MIMYEIISKYLSYYLVQYNSVFCHKYNKNELEEIKLK